MDLQQFIKPLLKWWWLLILATSVAAVSSYLIVRKQPNTYQAHTTIMIGNFIANPNPNSSEFYLAQQLASSYADIANRELIQNETLQALGLPYLPQNLTRAIPNTSLIEISVNDTDPKRAQAVANELANQLIKHSPSGLKPEEENRLKFVNDQLDTLQKQMTETQVDIEKLQQKLGDVTSAREISDMQNQIAALQQKFSSLQANYASLLTTTQQGSTNTLSIIEPAGFPTYPIGPNRLMMVALASSIGLALASLAAYGIEALDDTIKSVDEVASVIKAPILGYIGEITNEKTSVHVIEEPRSPVSDAFRILRTNLEFIGVKNFLQVILISSPDISDGKSTISLNLAASISQTNNRRVILIDADLRKPTLHRGLSVQNLNGLSEICLGSTGIQDAIISLGHNGEFSFIPSGTPPPNPAELLGSFKMSQVMEEIKSMADVVIIDSPPIFLADTVVLSGKVDGVLIVISLGHTRKKSITRMVDQIQRTGANLIGIVLNRVPISEPYYYSGYYHEKSKKKGR